ncbi:MAG: hypothetical protein FD153_815 [Rhodospirillaceae bacterium]|nr:MAG: hypothetical protein FD153_815 [Rhodospirillaceae bacterium]
MGAAFAGQVANRDAYVTRILSPIHPGNGKRRKPVMTSAEALLDLLLTTALATTGVIMFLLRGITLWPAGCPVFLYGIQRILLASGWVCCWHTPSPSGDTSCRTPAAVWKSGSV